MKYPTLKNGDIIYIDGIEAVLSISVNEPFFANLYRPMVAQRFENHLGQLYLKPSKNQVLLFLSSLPKLMGRSPYYEWDILYFFQNVTITPAPAPEKETTP